jgi:Undecaprenyl-phosphate glucose phosphotransferase
MLPAAGMPDAGTDFLVVALRTSMIGGLLAPLVLRPDWPDRDSTATMAVICRASVQVVVLLGLLLAIGFLTRTWIYVPRTWVLAWATMIFVTVSGGRLLLLQISDVSLVRRLVRERIAILGERSVADVAVLRLRRAHGRDIDIVGRFDNAADPDWRQPGELSREISRVIEYGKQHRLDKVVLALPDHDKESLDRVANQLKALNVDIVLYHGTIVEGRCDCLLDLTGSVQMTTLVSRPISQRGLVMKALQDKILSAILIVWLLPLMAIIALLIKLDSSGPVCFRQRRHGLNNTEFEVLKFRTMTWSGSDNATGVNQTKRNDSRVTRVGRFLRRSSLDELPQLLNVLRGEMSLVGPRPHPTVMRTENRLCEEIVADYSHRHRVKPGLTGWAQINGYRGATSTTEQVRRRVEHDLFYIENWSFFFDLKILALTPVRMILDSDSAF